MPALAGNLVANWPPIYIGKESDRHWEEGEDMTLLEFQAIQYKRKGNAVADDEQLARIAKFPKREFIRRKKISTRWRKFAGNYLKSAVHPSAV
jgi:hypothetical protein